MSIRAAGVMFVDSGFRGYLECADCGGLVADEGTTHGVAPSEHMCSA